eukprot:s1143_g11.t1
MSETTGPGPSTGQGSSAGSASHLPWHLIPSFEPGETDLTEYTRRLEFLAGIWPAEFLSQLAPRAALMCKGSAFQKVVRIPTEKLKVNDQKGVELLVTTLGGVWGKTTLEDKYEKFERAIYGVSQRSDESNESYVARHEILFEDVVAQGANLTDMRAYILLQNSALSPEDKKRVVIESKGNLKYDTVIQAIRMLGAKFFHEVQGQQKSYRSKTYEVNHVQDQEEESFVSEDQVYLTDANELPDSIVEQFLHEGDEDALVVQQFEDALIDTVQGDSEMTAYMNAYVEARRKLTEKSKSRGFWPIRSKGFGKKGKAKGQAFRARKPLAMRIAESDCRLCGQRGHWRAECPRRHAIGGSSSAGPPKSQPTNVMVSVNDVSDDEADVFVMETVSPMVPQELSSQVPEQAMFATSLTLGILDLGASQTVMGCHQLPEFLSHLPPHVRNMVYEKPVEMSFRFGNNSVVPCNRAIFVPIDKFWIKIAIVNSKTPFLISNNVCRCLGAVIDTNKQSVWFRQLDCELPLQLSGKKLFLLDLCELAAKKPPRTPSVLEKSASESERVFACQENDVDRRSEANVNHAKSAMPTPCGRKDQSHKLQSMSMEQLSELTIKFGDTKVGQTYRAVVTEDPKYCQWFLRKYSASEKPEHAEFIYFLSLWVERKELELGETIKNTTTKGMPKAKTGSASGKVVKPSTEFIDLDEEEESWDPVPETAQSIREEQNAQRLDQIENVLAQVMQQLQILSAKQD